MKRTNKYVRELKRMAALALIPLSIAACGGSSATSDVASTENFPESLAVASPLSYAEATVSASSSAYLRMAGMPATTPQYTASVDVINELLNGTTTADCTALFDAEMYFEQEVDSDCFGPTVNYDFHPDSGYTASGQLPSGDVGIWNESDVDGIACAASQLNARMKGVSYRANASLMALASLMCVGNANSISPPDATTPIVDYTSYMNLAAFPNTTFVSAQGSYDATSGAYGYHLELTYTDSFTVAHAIEVDMLHVPGLTGAFNGVVSYIVDDEFVGGNCPTVDATYNGSLEYEAVSATEMKTELKSGAFCGLGSDGRDASTLLVDAGDKYDAAGNPDGWGNNFSILTANYDPSTLVGNYAYSWQAGPGDGAARTFNLEMTDTESGYAFYGYGQDIETTGGAITDFICNWAGPGSTKNDVEYAQYQEIEVVTSGGTVVINPVVSNITYAPTNSCEYDGTGTFVFDTNADGLLTDEVSTLDITLASGTMDLIPGDDLDGDTNVTIEEVIVDAGFDLPSM